MLTSVKGSVSTMSIGRMKLLRSDITTAANMATNTLSTCTPLIKYDAIMIASVITMVFVMK